MLWQGASDQLEFIVFTREQADLISQQLLEEAKSTFAPKSIVPRENKLIPLVATQLLLLSVAVHFYNNKPLWVYGLLSFIFVAILIIGVYQYRHPLVEVNWTHLTYFGYWPFAKNSLSVKEIKTVTLLTKASFFHSGRQLIISHTNGQFSFWLPEMYVFSTAELNEFLRANFDGKFVEDSYFIDIFNKN